MKRKNYEHWSKSITQSIPYYKSRQYLSCENLEKGKLHPILKINCKSKGDLHRLPIKLKLLTGAYILQSNRIKIYKNELNTLCLLCEKDGETIEHFILECEQLKEVREPIIQDIDRVFNDCKLNWRKLSENVQLQLLLDITASTRNLKLDHDPTHSRRSRGQAKTCAYSYLNERSSANCLQETNTKYPSLKRDSNK